MPPRRMWPGRRPMVSMPEMRVPAGPPIRPAFTDDTPPPYDEQFETARALYNEFERLQGGERSAASMKWGDVRQGVANNLNANCFDIPWIDIGPFPEPTEIEVNMFIDPDPRNVASGGLPAYIPEWQWKAILGVGTGKLEKRTSLIQPRVFTCQSLTLFAADSLNLAVEPYRVGIYASRWRASNWPRPIGFSQYTMGIGTALIQLDWPPREATHMMVGKGSLSNITMGLRVGSGGGAIQEFVLTPGSATAFAGNPIFPIVPDATTWTLTRSASAASDQYTVWWLR
jgi:hypothetical protein